MKLENSLRKKKIPMQTLHLNFTKHQLECEKAFINHATHQSPVIELWCYIILKHHLYRFLYKEGIIVFRFQTPRSKVENRLQLRKVRTHYFWKYQQHNCKWSFGWSISHFGILWDTKLYYFTSVGLNLTLGCNWSKILYGYYLKLHTSFVT